MEKYKIKLFSKDALDEIEEKETEIPVILVETIMEALKKIELPNDEGETFYITPVMVNPNLKEISLGVMSREGSGPIVYKYAVSIQTREYWHDILERLNQYGLHK